MGGVAHHQKALSMSSYMMQPKQMSITQQQTHPKRTPGQAFHNNQGGGTVQFQSQGTVQSSKVQKKKAVTSQQLSFMNDPHVVKTMMVAPQSSNQHQTRMELLNHQSMGGTHQGPSSKTTH